MTGNIFSVVTPILPVVAIIIILFSIYLQTIP